MPLIDVTQIESVICLMSLMWHIPFVTCHNLYCFPYNGCKTYPSVSFHYTMLQHINNELKTPIDLLEKTNHIFTMLIREPDIRNTIHVYKERYVHSLCCCINVIMVIKTVSELYQIPLYCKTVIYVSSWYY